MLKQVKKEKERPQAVWVFLPPEGEVLVYLGGTLWRQVLKLKLDDLHVQMTYQNVPLHNPDFMVVVPDI